MIGGLVYLSDRASKPVVLITSFTGDPTRFDWFPSLFGALSGVAPDFLHVFAFSLITVGVLGRRPGIFGPVCLFWFMTDTLFELGQHVPDLALALIPQSLEQFEPVGWAHIFFTKGTFDPLDILAFAAGAIAAYALLAVMNKRSTKSWKPSNIF